MSATVATSRVGRAPIRVVIADDHGIVRSSLRQLLETRPEITVVGEAANGEEAVAQIERHTPDVALVDLAMPGTDGMSALRRICAAKLATRVLVMSALEDAGHIRDAFANGAAGFLPKSGVAPDLFSAIETVAAGRRYLHPRNVGLIAGPPMRAMECELSPRESEVLRLIALGYANKEIAAHLGVSVKTVETFKARAARKVGAHSRVDIVRFAIARGWMVLSATEPGKGSGGSRA